MSTEQDEKCYECYKAITENVDFSTKDSCSIYKTYKQLGEVNCPHFIGIKADVIKAQMGKRGLGSGATIVKMLVERGDIEIPDKNVLNPAAD